MQVRRAPGWSLALVTALMVASPASCSVPALQGAEYNGPKNTCNAGCADNASCDDGACKAAKTSYEMVLEVTPPSNAHYASDVTFPIDLGSGIGGEHELRLDALAQVTITVDATSVKEIVKAVPLSMRLTRVGALPGLAGVTYEARTPQAAAGAPIVRGKGSVSIAVPPGDYEVYLAPLDGDTLALLPPIDLGLVKASLGHFVSGPQEHVVVVNALKKFDLNITDEQGLGPLAEAVDGYDVSVIDTETGHLVSTVDRTCGHPGSAHLMLSPGLNQHTYVVRFAPPSVKCDEATDPPLRPTYDFDLDALSVDGSSIATVAMPSVATLTSGKSDGKSAPITVNVGGHVTKDGSPVKASLVFRSRRLSIPTTWRTGDAFYMATTTTVLELKGLLSLQVPAGQYDIQIIPSLVDAGSAGYAIGVVERRDLTATTNTIELSVGSKTTLHATPVSTENQIYDVGSADFLSASTSNVPMGALFAPLGRSKSVTLTSPRKNDPQFSSLLATLDPGFYDLIVRLPEPSGYGWIVAPNIEVATPLTTEGALDGCKGIVCLGLLKGVAPVILTGKVLDPSGDPVARATVRARAKLYEGDAGSTPALRAVVVGETKSNEDGSYKLVVPSEFAAKKTTVH